MGTTPAARSLRVVTNAAEFSGVLAEGNAECLDVAADINGLSHTQLAPGQGLTSLSGAVLTFVPGDDGLELTSDNQVTNLSIITDPARRAIHNSASVQTLGRIELSDLSVTGCVRIIAEGQIRAGHVIARGIDIVAADARGFEERPAGYGVEVVPGVFTVWNRQADAAIAISAELVGISAGRVGRPVRGGGVFVAGAGETGGRLMVSMLETGEIHSDGGIPPDTADRISGGVFTVSGAVVDVVRNAGSVTTYGLNDMVLDNWGAVDVWTAEAKITSHGASGIGFVNFGTINRLRVLAPIETHGEGARGFNVYAGTVDDAEFERVVTHGNGAVGVQISQPVGRIVVKRGIETNGGVGNSLVKGVVKRLPAIALSIKPGGSARSIEVAGGVVARGESVAPVEVHGSVGMLIVTEGMTAGGGFEGI